LRYKSPPFASESCWRCQNQEAHRLPTSPSRQKTSASHHRTDPRIGPPVQERETISTDTVSTGHSFRGDGETGRPGEQSFICFAGKSMQRKRCTDQAMDAPEKNNPLVSLSQQPAENVSSRSPDLPVFVATLQTEPNSWDQAAIAFPFHATGSAAGR
jgi:hypothetical protein